MRKHLLISSVSFLVLTQVVKAADFSVANEAQLIAAINSVNATSGTHTITLTSNVTLTGTAAMGLPPILNSVTINGGNFALSGNANSRLLLVGTDNSSGANAVVTSRPAVTINNLALNNGTAKGGSGAGGGMGAGGALFVGSTADVTINNVSFAGNSATGGVGGSTIGGGGMGGNGATGGGGLSGNAGASGGGLLTAGTAGGGGYGQTLVTQGVAIGGAGATGATSADGAAGGGFNPLASSLGSGGTGGFGGGGGASGTTGMLGNGGNGGFGGGGGVAQGTNGIGGKGGFGGGGGGGVTVSAGSGGFGGGGGGTTTGTAGKGGFGGGGGFGSNSVAGFGGTAGTASTGGNGAALGGAVFVMNGGSLTYGGDSTMAGGTVAAGASAQASGSGIFIQGANFVKFAPGAGKTVTVSDTISDQNGLVMAGYAPATGTFNGTEKGSVLISGAGTVKLTGTNIYSGGTIVENTAVLVINNNSNLGAAAADLTLNGATLKAGAAYASNRNIIVGGNATIDNAGFLITHSGVISGPGKMQFSGAGQTNLTGANTFFGGIEINHTKVGINSDASLGQAGVPIALVSGGTVVALSNVVVNRNTAIGSDGLTFDTNGFNSSWGGVMSGGGALNLAGNGTLALTSANTFTGGTNVATGSTLTLGNGTTQGSLVGNVVNNGTFAVNSNAPQVIDNNVTGTGGIAINGTGVIAVTGTIASSGPVQINSGTLQLGNGGTTGTVTGPINIAPTGTLAVNHSNPLTLTQPITGTGTLALVGPGLTTLTGATPFTGTTNIGTGSTLQLGNGTTNGTLGGTLVNNGTLVLNNPTAQTVTANISGGGGITQMGTGTTTLTGTTTGYTGTTTITNGTLVVNGTLTGPVVTTGGGQIVVNGNVGGGVISGGGNTTVNVGSVISGGMTTVAPNMLTVNGTVTGAVDIVSGSTLIGAGTIGGGTIAGTVSPGATAGEIGTLKVNGPLEIKSTGVADMGITPNSNDQIKVTGATTLNGTLKVTAAAGTYTPGTRYTLIDGQGGVSGTFTTTQIVGAPLGSNILSRFDYKPKSVDLVLSAATLSPYLTGQSAYVKQMGAAMDAHAGTVGNRGVLNPLYDLAPSQMAKAINQFSGQAAAGGGIGLGRASGQFMNSVTENGIRSGMMGNSGGGGGQALPVLAPSAPAAMPAMRQASNTQTSDQPKMALAYVGETIIYVDEKGEKRKAVRGKKVIADKRKYIPLAQAGIIQNTQSVNANSQFYVVQGQPVVSQNLQGLTPGQMYVVRGQNGQTADQVYMVQNQATAPVMQQLNNQGQVYVVQGQNNGQTQNIVQNGATQVFGQANQQQMPVQQQVQSNTQRFGGAQVSHTNGVDQSLTTASTGKSARQPDSVVWGSLLGGGGMTQANASTGSAAMSNQTYGISGGVTYQPEHNFIVGAALSAVSLASSSGEGLGSTSGSGIQAAIYGRFNEGSLYIGNVFSFGGSFHTVDRTISIGALNQSLKGETSATAFGNRTEVGYRMGNNDLRFIPFAALAITQMNQKGFSEKDNTGAAAGNSYSAFQQTAVRSEIGLQFEKMFNAHGAKPLSVKGQLAWGHLVSSKGSMSAVYAPIPTISFAVPMASPERDYLLAGLSTEWHLRPQMQAFLGLSGEFATGSTQIQARIGLKSAW